MFIFSNRHVNQFLHVSFPSSYPASKGNAFAMKVTWRIQYTSIFAFGMNGAQTRGKWGDGKWAGSQMSPFSTETGRGAIAWKGMELRGGYILNSEWVKMSPCISIFIPFQWRPCHLFLHLQVQRWCLWLAAPQPPAGIWKSSCPPPPLHSTASHQDPTGRK